MFFSGKSGTTVVLFPFPPQKEHFLEPLQYEHTPFFMVQKGHSWSSKRFARFSSRAQARSVIAGMAVRKRRRFIVLVTSLLKSHISIRVMSDQVFSLSIAIILRNNDH
jgi:hypothetical protein